MAYYILTAKYPTELNSKKEIVWETADHFTTLVKARKELERLTKKALRSLSREDREWSRWRYFPKDSTVNEALDFLIYGKGDRNLGNGWELHVMDNPYRGIASTNAEDARKDYSEEEYRWDFLFFKYLFTGKRGSVPPVLLEAIAKYEGKNTAL